MQDTPNFETYKTRFNSFLLPSLVDNPSQPVGSPEREVIEGVYNKMATYFTENKFRETLSLNRKNNIESNINAALDQFQQIMNFVATTPPQLVQNIQGITNNLQSYLEEIDLRFWTPYQVYVLGGNTDITQTVADIKKGAREVAAAKDKSEENLKAAGLLISTGAEVEVANYFQKSVNGLSAEDNDKLVNDDKTLNTKYIAPGAIISAIVIALCAPRLTQIISGFNRHNPEHYIYLAAILLVLCAHPIKLYVDWLQKTRPSGYERAASLWIVGAIASVVGTGIYAAILLSSFDGSAGINELVPKIVSLLAPAYLIRFCVQNYKANKHIATMNSQKALASRSLLAFTANLSTSDESLKASNNAVVGDIQKAVATIIFDPGETGFITVKEGAGSTDSFFQGTSIDKFIK